MAQAIRDPEELLRELQLPLDLLPAARRASELFPLRVPRSFVQRMEKANPDDPLLRQVLPLTHELELHAGFVTDPTADGEAAVIPGLLNKYQGRALLITTPACAIHCRYCFRRHFPYEEHHGLNQADTVARYLAEHENINELILSGGDPLTLSNRRLHSLTDRLHDIPHLKRLRIHSRQPIVLPERIDHGLLDWLDSLPWQTVMVIHCNHPNEIDLRVSQQLSLLRPHLTSLLNQSVLLKGVNDDVETLVRLSEKLFANQVLPYYLHTLDPVQGAQHFHVDQTRTKELFQQTMQRLPGYLVPRLVTEIPGAGSKVPLNL